VAGSTWRCGDPSTTAAPRQLTVRCLTSRGGGEGVRVATNQGGEWRRGGGASPVKGGQWCLWTISSERGGISDAWVGTGSKGSNGGVSRTCDLGRRWHGKERQ
jgi:hypothetical protein